MVSVNEEECCIATDDDHEERAENIHGDYRRTSSIIVRNHLLFCPDKLAAGLLLIWPEPCSTFDILPLLQNLISIQHMTGMTAVIHEHISLHNNHLYTNTNDKYDSPQSQISAGKQASPLLGTLACTLSPLFPLPSSGPSASLSWYC